MKLKNVLIVVKDIEKRGSFITTCSIGNARRQRRQYGFDRGGLPCKTRRSGAIFLGKDIIPRSNSSELYFEEKDIEGFIEKLERLYPSIEYVNRLTTHS